jgi:hypothetical protein
MISFFKNISDKSPKTISLAEFIEIVRSKREYANVLAIRRAQTKEEKTKLKKFLSAVTLSGVFEGGHSEKHLVKHSGYMQIDFDNLQNVKEIKEKLQADKFTLACFISPSGAGVKGVVRIGEESHLQAFERLRAYYLQTYNLQMDEVCKDVTRLCFTSFDQQAFYNEKAETFTPQSFTLLTPKEQKPEKAKSAALPPAGNVRDDVEKVVRQITQYHIDIAGPKPNYDNWRNIGFALASEFGESGRDYFHAVSRFDSSYKPSETDKQYTECCKGRKNGISIKTFFGYAKDYGIDIKPERAKPYTPAPKVKTAQIEPQKQQIDISINPSDTDILLSPIPTDSKDPNNDFLEYGFFYKNGKYFVRETKHNRTFDIEISNFLFEILYQFDDGTNNTKRLIKIQRNTGEIKVKEVLDSEASPEKFETILKSFRCSFYGSSYNLKKIYVANMDKERKAIYINQLGYNKEFNLYAFSDAIVVNNNVFKVNNIGIINNGNDCFYLPAWAESNLENKAFENERRFCFKPGNHNFESWSKLVYEAFDIKGAIGICFLINTLFRDIIINSINFFPFMYLFGQAGGGKTTYIDSVLRLFGEKDPGTPATGSTEKAIARVCGQRVNALTYIKEFDKNVAPMLIPMMKSFYDGVGYATAQTSNDNRTNTFPITSGLIIDGNVLPIHEPAFFDRFIIVQFEDNKFTEQNKQAYNKLINEYDNGFGRVFLDIWQHRDHFKAEFKKAFHCISEQLKGRKAEYNGEVYNDGAIIIDGFNVSRLPERNINHIAFLLSTYYILNKKLKFPFSFSELAQKVIADALEKNDMLTEIKDVNVFWDSFNYAIKNVPSVEGYFLKGLLDKILYIKINELYPFYVDYCKKSLINAIDKQTLLKLLTVESSGFIPNTSQKGRGKAYTKDGFGSCYRFRFDENNGTISIAGKELYI